MVTEAKLKFWIENNYNVLFEGEHGVGKTARVIQAFNNADLKWLYFSASTLDPWVDFIGVPKEVVDENGNKYLDLVRPKVFANDEVEAIFLDEYNRSQKKVRNAVMELIQFKSINGKKFNNLRIVWVAVNPDNVKSDDEEMVYDVEKLDPAQKDRFHIHAFIPYKCDRGYFIERYNDNGSNAVDWWNELDEKAKRLVSPRRLDYALDVYSKGGDIRDVLPSSNGINVTKLLTELKNGSFVKNMQAVATTNDPTKIAEFIQNRNNYDNTIQKILKSNELLAKFIPHFRSEDLVNLMGSEDKVYQYVISNHTKYQELIKSIKTANNQPKLIKRIDKDIGSIYAQNLRANNGATATFSTVILLPRKNSPTTPSGYNSYADYIAQNHCSARLGVGTPYRIAAYSNIYTGIGNNETKEVYLQSMDMIAEILSRTHMSGWKRFPNLPQFFGWLMQKCMMLTGKKPTEIINGFKLTEYQKNRIKEFIIVNAQLYI